MGICYNFSVNLKTDIEIRPATRDDFPAMHQIFKSVVSTGDTFIYDPEMPASEVKELWLSPGYAPFVALKNGRIVGMSVVRPILKGRGSHIANASFMVDPDAQGQGVGTRLGELAITEAKRLGYIAMQFNIVVSTNTHAVGLWRKLGFNILASVPQGFSHKEKGLVDSYIMYRPL